MPVERALRPLEGQVALVTGGAIRVGRAICAAIAAEGAGIVIHYNRSETEALDLRDALSAEGVHSWTIGADLSRPDQAKDLVQRALDAAGRLDILVNSASIYAKARLLSMDIEHLLKSIRIHAWAPLVLSRCMAERSRSGRIVNILDGRVVHHEIDHAGYAIGKQMLSTLTVMLARELAPRFTVNAVSPGPVLPPPGSEEDYVERKSRELPLMRTGTPMDVAKAVVFLVENSFITGQTLYVDGGGHLPLT